MATAAERVYVNTCSLYYRYVCNVHVRICACTSQSACVCAQVCIDYSVEIAARVYEQIETQLLIEEVVRVSDCKSLLNLQLYCPYSLISSY